MSASVGQPAPSAPLSPAGPPAAPPRPAVPACPNCGDTREGNFCPNCGQERRIVRVSLREMLSEFLDDQLALNSKLPRSVAFLLARPGHLTREYLNCRIARYIRPLRLYLGASVLFFLLFSLVSSRWEGEAPVSDAPAREQVDTTPGGSAPAPPVTIQLDTAGLNREVLGPLAAPLEERINRINHMDRRELARRFIDGLGRYLPRMMFVLLPVFALLLQLLYFRSRRFYVEHFVFSLHLHAFLFLLFTLIIGMRAALGARAESLDTPLAVWAFLYLFLAMWKVYRQSILKTFAKYWMLLFSYMLVLALGFAGTSLVILYFL